MTDYRNAPPELFIFTGTEAGTQPFVRAVHASTGQLAWNTPLPKEAIFELVLAVGSGRVAVVTGKGHLYMVDQQSGHALWSAELKRTNPGNYNKGMVTISTHTVHVYLAGHLTTFSFDGKRLWQVDGVDVDSMGSEAGVVHYDRRGS